ncbi:MAG TPA: hypothetical protein VI259_15575, partial [Gemmatimonadaceae bacterium]
RLPDGDDRPPLVVVVVVDDGMFAMTADRMSVGETPSVVAEVHPARESTETAAIAPARACEGVIMPRAKHDWRRRWFVG